VLVVVVEGGGSVGGVRGKLSTDDRENPVIEGRAACAVVLLRTEVHSNTATSSHRRRLQFRLKLGAALCTSSRKRRVERCHTATTAEQNSHSQQTQEAQRGPI